MSWSLSNYNYVVSIDNEYILYNSLTGAILRVYEKSKLNLLENVLKKNTIQSIENDFIKSLIDYGILVKEGTDELTLARMQYETSYRNKKRLDLCFIVNRECNFNCTYCYEKHSGDEMEKSLIKNIYTWLSKYLENGAYNKINISWFGGEPLLSSSKIIFFMKKILTLKKKYNILLEAGMTTNGYLLDEGMFRRLYEIGINNYQITLDGMKETHDIRRPLISSKGTWDVIINNLKKMQETKYDFNVVIRVNYDYDVIETTFTLLDLIADVFDERFSVHFHPITKLGGENDEKIEVCDEETKSIANTELIKAAIERNINPRVFKSFLKPFGRMCYAADANNLVVDWDGTLRKCTVVIDNQENDIGYITDEGDIVINNNKFSKWVISDYMYSTKCIDCKQLPLCFGMRCPKRSVINDIIPECSPDDFQIKELLRTWGRKEIEKATNR